MKRMLALSMAVMIFVCTGCGDSQDSLTAESVSTMKEMVATLDGVKDEASAISAKPKLKSLMEKMTSINERQAKLPAPTEAEVKSLGSKYSSEMDDLSRKLQGNMMRITFDPKIQAVLADIDTRKALR